MSFWSTSTGEDLAKTKAPKEYDAGGGGYITIPDGSTVMAYIKEVKWEEDRDKNRHVKIQWKVQQPEQVVGAVVFQKLWVTDDDPNAKDPAKKRDKAIRMLATIDANCGGKLTASGTLPNDDQLTMALINKEMAITCKIWEMTGSDGASMSGNWVAAVAPKTKELKLTGPVEGAAQKPLSDDLEDDIPF